jgi:hypothetical protein
MKGWQKVTEKRFVGFMATHEGTGAHYHEVVHKLYCSRESCDVKGRYHTCINCGQPTCEHLIDEVQE